MDLDLLMIKELLYETVDSVVDGVWHENYGDKDLTVRDSIVTQICDEVARIVDC